MRNAPAPRASEAPAAPGSRGSFASDLLAGFSETVRDAGERRLQLAAESIDDGDDRHRNARGDQAVLDCGRTGLIPHKAPHPFQHIRLRIRNTTSDALQPSDRGFHPVESEREA